ncbi:AlbA family DNA-binding domain-containing protein [Dyadobacter aurulentus]|uniref:AlbA family DNA-binding domain-containing protein n=1 Tax=Dyadobacter sp. UC 10 TaxID=2605428 RepID=UPI0011F2B24D|nr:RNA-binding domain-containing protein [Dyadobacter sp. UC 10]KAA0993745.1 ATP-binding protein [Dyadobacter sp. UC 10]
MIKSIGEIISAGEGLSIEFKRRIDNPAKIARTIVSFANTSGGILMIGVADSGIVTGVSSELAELQKLEKASLDFIEPRIHIQIKSERIDGKQVMLVFVQESAEKPHYVVGERGARTIYIRVKDKSVPIPKLLLYNSDNLETEKLLASRHVKSLIAYLKSADAVSAKMFSKMINISEKRADRMLHDLAARQILLKIPGTRPEAFSLKWTE